jgi:branched-chain amino acid aminotransferase
MPHPLAYLNGRFLPFAEAALPLHDAGFVSGATVVDNARTFRHKLFRWPDHVARFRRDCEACYVPLVATDEQLTAAAEELIAHNAKLLPPGGELQLVTFATPGPLGFYLGEPANGPPTLGMATYPVPVARYRRFFTDGVTLAVAGFQHSSSDDLVPPRVKHRSRMVWHVAGRTLTDPNSELYWRVPGVAATDPTVVPVVLNWGQPGKVEGAGDTAIGTILIVLDDTILGPVPGTVQEGISAKVVAELCGGLGLRTHYDAPLNLGCFARPVQPWDEKTILPRVSELLLVGTGFCVAGVRRFGGRDHYRDYAWPGPVYRRLLAAWSDLVGVDIEKSFTG